MQGTFAAFSDSQIDKLRMAVLKNDPADGNFVYGRDPVIARADTNVSSGDDSGADDVVVSLSCERIINLLSTDRLFCVVNLSTSGVYMTSGNWIIEKLG